MLEFLCVLAVLNFIGLGLLGYAGWKASARIQDQLDVLNIELVGFTVPLRTIKDLSALPENPEEVLSEIGNYQGPSGWH